MMPVEPSVSWSEIGDDPPLDELQRENEVT